MENQPNRIYLNIGFDPAEELNVDFKELEEVTWCADRQNPWDLPYISEKSIEKEFIDFGAKLIEWYNMLSPSELCTVHAPAASGGGTGLFNLPIEEVVKKFLRIHQNVTG